MSRLDELQYVVVDVETTGGSPVHGDRVTELAAICMDGTGRVVDEFTSLVNPCRPIPPFITRLTGISDDMVRHAPPFAEVAASLLNTLAGRVFVAHNAAFDWRFVSAELERTGYEAVAGKLRLCTLRLARRLVPEVSSRSLGSLADYFDIEIEDRHRAYGDARATCVLLRRLLERVEEHEVYDWAALETLLRRRTPRRKRTALPHPADVTDPC